MEIVVRLGSDQSATLSFDQVGWEKLVRQPEALRDLLVHAVKTASDPTIAVGTETYFTLQEVTP